MSKAKHLYIIGNGFDLHHGIPSRYSDFRQWLYQEHKGIIDDNFHGCDNDEWWNDFESHFADINIESIAMEETMQNMPNFGSDDFKDRDWYIAESEAENRIIDIYATINEELFRWARQLPTVSVKKVRFESRNAIFLTFNYTLTLEKLYRIPSKRILHIHGSVNKNAEGIVIGHDSSYYEIHGNVKPYSYRGDDDDIADSEGFILNRTTDACISVVSDYRKPVYEIINHHQEWMQSLNDITHIHVYGHSFGDIDMPYFEYIAKTTSSNNVFWEISAFSETDRKRIEQFVLSQKIANYKIIDLQSITI